MKTLILTLGVLLLGPTAFAGKKLSYGQLKEACRNPEKFHNQIKPANLEITCSDVQTQWLPIEEGSFNMGRIRKISINMTSDKYDVPATSRELPVERQMGVCPRFKEVVEKVQLTRPTTCEEILDFDGNEIEFCAGMIDDVRRSNPGSIIIGESGRTIHFCSPSPSRPGNGGNGDQDQGKGRKRK